MLRLRKEHLEAFEAQIVSNFALRVLAHVKAVWPMETGEMGDAPTLELVKAAIKKGGALGLTIEFDIVRFVDLTFILGKDFDTNPLAMWMRPVLADRTLTPTAKIDKLYQRMEEEFAMIEKRKGPRQ